MFSGPCVWKDLNIRDGKMLKPLHYHQKLRRNLFLKPKGGFFTPRADKNQKMSNFQRA